MSTILYTVWYDIDPTAESEWNKWMETSHVPDVVNTGGFLCARRYKVVEGSPSQYVTIYEARDMKSLKRYLEGPAKRLREDYQKHFGSKSKINRITLEQISSHSLT